MPEFCGGTMRIRMRESCRGTEDGFVLRMLRAGEIYEVRDCLACRLLNEGRAEQVEKESTHGGE
jgi:hypothetical protein